MRVDVDGGQELIERASHEIALPHACLREHRAHPDTTVIQVSVAISYAIARVNELPLTANARAVLDVAFWVCMLAALPAHKRHGIAAGQPCGATD